MFCVLSSNECISSFSEVYSDMLRIRILKEIRVSTSTCICVLLIVGGAMGRTAIIKLNNLVMIWC